MFLFQFAVMQHSKERTEKQNHLIATENSDSSTAPSPHTHTLSFPPPPIAPLRVGKRRGGEKKKKKKRELMLSHVFTEIKNTFTFFILPSSLDIWTKQFCFLSGIYYNSIFSSSNVTISSILTALFSECKINQINCANIQPPVRAQIVYTNCSICKLLRTLKACKTNM